MTIKKQLVKRVIADDVILVPVGEASLELKGLMMLNETGELLWDALPTAESKEDLVNALREEYEVDAETAAADVSEFLDTLKKLEIL
ncbi:MAG: PqqD family protein [Clostridia bacterium]|nr:PqqD family protein [Clostridia bacterium]